MRVTRTVRAVLAGALMLGIIGAPLAAPSQARAAAEASQVVPNEVAQNEVEPGEGVAGIIAGAAGALILLGVGSFVARRRIS